MHLWNVTGYEPVNYAKVWITISILHLLLTELFPLNRHVQKRISVERFG